MNFLTVLKVHEKHQLEDCGYCRETKFNPNLLGNTEDVTIYDICTVSGN